MNIYTLNVGQGQFVVVTGSSEAIIVDTYLALDPDIPIVNIKAALAKILTGKNLVGLMITGFDADHFCEIGLKVVLNKYRPDWLMYPRYYKNTATADACFNAINAFERQKQFDRYWIELSNNNLRFYNNISHDFSIECFSPHAADMNSSNNCSLVCKITEKSSGATYLVTGDTENDRWKNILAIFGSNIAARALAAPHHGSRNGTSDRLIQTINPSQTLVSAGVNNTYGHPHQEAIAAYTKFGGDVWQTNWPPSGQSLRTAVSGSAAKTFLFETN